MNNASGGNIIFHFKGDTKGLSSSMGGLTKSFALGTLAAKGISKALQVISSNIGDAVKRVDTLNNFPKVMKAFGVSTKEAQASIKRIDKSIRGLPTSLDTAVSGVRDFFMVTKNLKQAEAMFKAVNDSALIFANGSQEAVQRFTYAYKQSLAAGKVDAQNFRQMNEAIPGVMDKVAQSMGMSMQQLKSGLADGSISMDQFNAELIKLDTQGGAGMKSFGETAKTSTAGIQTSITNMKTAFVRGLGDIINKVNESLKPFGGLSGVISKIGQIGEAAFKKIGQVLAFILPKLAKFGQFIAKHKTAVLILAGAIGSLYLAFKTLMIVNTVRSAINGFRLALSMLKIQAMLCGTSMSTLRGALALLNLSFLTSPIFWIIAGIIALVAVFVVLWKKCAAFRNFWKGVWDGIVKAVKPVIDTIKKTFDTQLKPALNNLMKALKQLWTALQPVINFIVTVVIACIKMVIQQIQLLWQILSPIISFIIQAIGVVISVVIMVVTKIIQFITMIIGAITWLITHITEIPGKIIAFIGKIPEYIGYVIGFIIGLIVKLITRLIQFVTRDIPNFINGVVKWFAELPGKIWKFLTQLPGKIGQAISNMVNKAKSTIPNVVNAIVNGLKKAISKVGDIGKNIVKGLWNGIKGMASWVIDKIKGFGKGLIKGLKSALGIHSPSKLMADEVGQWIPKGIAVGIEANADSVSKTMSEMNDMITSSFGLDPNVANSMSNNFSPTVNTTVNVNQTQDPLGRMVNDVKTFSGGSRQDYNYGLGG
jgi:tape measure domain-containing protein